MTPFAASPPFGARRGPPAAVAAATVLLAASPALAQDRVQVFDIPAGDAASTLLRLCMEADCDLAFARRPGQGVRTRAVRGRMSWRTALSRMTQGTDLRHRFVGARGVRVWIASPEPGLPSPGPAVPASGRAPPPSEAFEVEPVVVVGRLSDQIDQALRRKRQSDVISDGVTSERIGDLPAANLAEALQRVPGVAIEREVGEGQFVSVRGLGPLFQSVTLNGAPVAFNENIRNSTQSGRQFRFRALSVDLLAGARLTKSSTADLIDGGIGSNIDIETAGGLDGDPFLSLRLGGAVEARTDEAQPQLSVAGRAMSADGRRGLIFGLSQEARAVRYDRFQIMRYGATAIGGERLVTPNDVRMTAEREDRRRRSAFLGVDWRVSPDLAFDFDGMVSTFDNAIREDRLVFVLGERLAAPGAVTRVEDGVVTAARIANGRIDNNTEISDQAHLNVAAALGASLRLGDWTLTPRLSLSRADSALTTPLERFSAQSPSGVAYVLDLGRATATRRAQVLTTDFDLLDPKRLTLAQLSIRAVESRDDDATFLFKARRPLDRALGGVRLTAVSLGGQFSDRGRDYQRRDRRAAPRDGATGVAGFYDGATPDDVFADLVVARSAPWAVIDFQRVRAAFHVPGETGDVVFRPRDLAPTGADRQNDYRVGEQATAAYGRLDFDGAFGTRAFSGNLGLRWAATRTRVQGARLEAVGGIAEVRPVEFHGSHGVLLPSFNLALETTEAAILRLAASRSLTRPSLADLRAATVPASILVGSIQERGQAAIDDPDPGMIFSGVGGNPALTPYVSTNLDLSYEVVRPRSSYSLALFHKTIDDFIQAVAAPEILAFETRAGPAVRAEVSVSRPRNVGRAVVQGLELGLHRRLDHGLGVWASATWTDSRLDDGGRLTGVSDLAWSVSPYLERGPLSLNLSWSWRSAFRSEADMQGGGVSDFIVAAAGYLDAQAAYRLSDHAELILAASNLSDTRDLAYEGVRSRLLQIGSVGRQLQLEMRWAW